MFDLRRREFITLIGGAAAAWPMATRAQQPARPAVGFLRVTSAVDSTHLVAAFQQGLKETGFVDGQNVTMEYRWADGQEDRLPELAADLVRRRAACSISARFRCRFSTRNFCPIRWAMVALRSGR